MADLPKPATVKDDLKPGQQPKPEGDDRLRTHALDVAYKPRETESPPAAALTDTQKGVEAYVKVMATDRELRQILRSNISDTTQVSDGGVHQRQSAGDLRKTLQEELDANLKTTINVGEKLPKTGPGSISAELDKFTSATEPRRLELMQKYGLKANSTTGDNIDQVLTTTKLDDTQRKELLELRGIQDHYDALHLLQKSPSLVRLQMAEALRSGELNPDGTQAKAGQTNPAQAETAFRAVHEASVVDQSGEIRATDQFKGLVRGTNDQLALIANNPTVSHMLGSMQQAVELEGTNPQAAGAKYAEAMADSQKLGLSQLMKDIGNQTDPVVAERMRATILGGITTQEEYARFQLSQGNNVEALKTLTDLMKEPMLQKDAIMNQLLTRTLNGGKDVSDDPAVHLRKIKDAFDGHRYEEATNEVQKLKTSVSNLDFDAIKKNVDFLKDQQQSLEKQKQALADNKGLSAADRAAQTQALDQQLGTNQMLLSKETVRSNLKNQSVALDGLIDVYRGDNTSAKEKINQLPDDWPNKKEMLTAAEGPSFMQKYGKTIAIVGAAVAAGAAFIIGTATTGIGGVPASAAAWIAATSAIVAGTAEVSAVGLAVGTTAALAAGTGTEVAIRTLGGGEQFSTQMVIEGLSDSLLSIGPMNAMRVAKMIPAFSRTTTGGIATLEQLSSGANLTRGTKYALGSLAFTPSAALQVGESIYNNNPWWMTAAMAGPAIVAPAFGKISTTTFGRMSQVPIAGGFSLGTDFAPGVYHWYKSPVNFNDPYWTKQYNDWTYALPPNFKVPDKSK